jgi:hypothetical protein
MRTSSLILFIYLSCTCQVNAKSTLSGDERKLLNLAYTLKAYMDRSGGELPADLIPLRDYIDLPRLLLPENDPMGPFPDRYAFLPAKPWIEAPGEPSRQLLLISVEPLPDGGRGAIWRYRTGEYAGGIISAKELERGLDNFNLANLKPMGGEVPAPTRSLQDPPITDYQAKVMQLFKEGKITPPPQNLGSSSKRKSNPPTLVESLTTKAAPTSTPSAPTGHESLPSFGQYSTSMCLSAMAFLLVAGVAFFAWKRRS